MTQPPNLARSLFIDTSALYAALTPSDDHYDVAGETLRRTAREGKFFVVSNFIVAETHALFLTRQNRRLALRFLTELDRSRTVVLRLTLEDEREARRIIEAYDAKDFSYTDATSFALIKRMGIPSALSFDRHFLQFGIPGP